MKIRAVQNTFLKQSTEQASDLPQDWKMPITTGQNLAVLEWQDDEDGHVSLKLASKFNGTDRWFAFGSHLQILEDNDALIEVSNANPDTAPISDRLLPPEPAVLLPPKTQQSTRLITVCGTQYNLYSPIIDGGNFLWAEALHNGQRIPKRKEHKEAIERLARELQKARNQIGKPFEITSWYRPEPWNSRAKGAKKSQHLTGGAVDIKVEGMSGRELARELSWWQGGLGIYKNMPQLLHLDVRGYRARWNT